MEINITKTLFHKKVTEHKHICLTLDYELEMTTVTAVSL